MSLRRTSGAVCALAVLAVGATPADAAYDGVRVKGSGFIGPGGSDVQLRLVCPPRTQSTPRPGDFSFCTGSLTVSVRGVVVARGPFSIRTFDSHLEHFPTLPGRRGRLAGRRVTVRWLARSHDGRGRFAQDAGTTTVRR
ncbi:MAG: hypothetical protein QOE65_545 [Solirubrobacteraceae bacterium]|jgi:hypothetical protein|nr:hypothetical protein [Solirubrobacteraceae bacterium]